MPTIPFVPIAERDRLRPRNDGEVRRNVRHLRRNGAESRDVGRGVDPLRYDQRFRSFHQPTRTTEFLSDRS